jgi:hypothetical protein
MSCYFIIWVCFFSQIEEIFDILMMDALSWFMNFEGFLCVRMFQIEASNLMVGKMA